MNRKRKPQQRKRANKKILRNRRGNRIGQHVLDVKVKRREGEGIRRHIRLPLIVKLAAITAGFALAAYIGTNILGRFLWNNPAYTLTTIEYETNGSLTRPVALEIAEVKVDVNVLQLKLDKIRERLVALEQVKEATVIRVLPDKLGISIEERHPVAWLHCPPKQIFAKVQAKGILLDEEGVALPCRQMRNEYANLPIISVGGEMLAKVEPGKPIQSDDLVTALQLAVVSDEVFYDHGLEIVKIEVVNDYSLLARYNNRTEVKFKPAEIVRQVDDLRAIFEDSIKKNRLLETVNLLPDRNIPITYARPRPASSAPPRARRIEPATESVGMSTVATEPRTVRRAVRARRSIPAASRQIDDVDSILNRP